MPTFDTRNTIMPDDPVMREVTETDPNARLSGRDLDAAVAERVMGWQRQPDYNYWMSFPAGESFKLHALIATWKPSEDIKAAMEVVKWLTPTMQEYNAGRKSCRFIMRQQDSGLWCVEARSPFLTSYSKPAFADGNSLPEAICRAALSATEGNK